MESNGHAREAVMLRVIREVLDERFAAVEPGAQTIQFPAPQVRNMITVPVPEVKVENTIAGTQLTVDMEPVALALASMADAFTKLWSEFFAKALAALAKPAPPVNLTIPETAAIDVTPIADALADRPKRKFKITHDDGTESTVTEI